jgi:hypothetical protein
MSEQQNFLDLAAPGPRRGERPMPSGARIARCASCDAEIVWARTEGERAIPLSLATVQTRDGVQYLLPHFVDCEHAKEWSSKKRKR